MDKKIKNKASVLKKTDSAVKTAEAWTAFATVIWEAKGFFTPVLALGGVMITAVVKIFSLGWEYAVLAAIPLIIVAAIVWLGLSWIWHLRPSAKQARESKIPRLEQADKEKDAQDSHIAPLTKSSLEEILGRISALEETNPTDELTEYVARYVGDATAKMDRLEGTFHAKFHTLTEENNRGIDALFANKKMSDALTFTAIAEIFEARKGLHLQNQLLQEIDELTVYLDTKEVPTDFIHEHQEWEQKVKDWHEGLGSYILTPSSSPITFDPKRLRSTRWQDWVKEINDSDIQISVKTFSIQKDNFAKVRTRYIGLLTDKAHSSLRKGGGGRLDIVKRFTD